MKKGDVRLSLVLPVMLKTTHFFKMAGVSVLVIKIQALSFRETLTSYVMTDFVKISLFFPSPLRNQEIKRGEYLPTA